MDSVQFAMFCAVKWIMKQRGYGRVKTREIIDRIDDIECFSFGSYLDLTHKFGHLDLPFREWIQKRNTDELKACYEEQLKYSDGMIHYWSPNYPSLLKEVNDPPLILYYKGDSSLLSERKQKIAIVGTRCPTDYGRKFGAEISRIASQSSMTVVSGMAMGIDAVAHMNALEVNGHTIGVLGSGVDQCYPRQNKQLYLDMCKRGLIVSEYEAKTQPHPIHFPERNRIIAGLSDSCAVIEAAKKSGSLITAEMVMDLGREVMALPGPIYSEKSAGCHMLIRSGAEPIIDLVELKRYWKYKAVDFEEVKSTMNHLNHCPKNEQSYEGRSLSEESKLIIEALNQLGQASVEELMMLTGLSFGVLNETIFNLENDKIVKSFGFFYHL